MPAGLFELLKIPGLGPKKVKSLYDKLSITTIGELEYACKENRLRDLQGFGQKSQDKNQSRKVQRVWDLYRLLPARRL